MRGQATAKETSKQQETCPAAPFYCIQHPGQQVMWITHREGVSWDNINDDRLVAMFCQQGLCLLFSLEKETHTT